MVLFICGYTLIILIMKDILLALLPFVIFKTWRNPVTIRQKIL